MYSWRDTFGNLVDLPNFKLVIHILSVGRVGVLQPWCIYTVGDIPIGRILGGFNTNRPFVHQNAKLNSWLIFLVIQYYLALSGNIVVKAFCLTFVFYLQEHQNFSALVQKLVLVFQLFVKLYRGSSQECLSCVMLMA